MPIETYQEAWDRKDTPNAKPQDEVTLSHGISRGIDYGTNSNVSSGEDTSSFNHEPSKGVIIDDIKGKDPPILHTTCEKCHELRHSLNLSPLDVVHGLCGQDTCNMKPSVCNSDLAAPSVRSKGNSENHFIIRSTCEGNLLKTLLDTGATTNFIATHVIDNNPALKEKVERISGPPSSVRLGNNSVQLVRHQLKVNVWIGNQSFNLSFLVMPLPHGIDTILGMSFFNRYDVWLHPKGKRILVPDVSKQQYHTLASCAYFDEDDTHLIRQAHLSDDATKSHLKNPNRVPPSAHDKRNTTLHGLA